MKKKSSFLLLIFSFLLIFTGCSSDSDGSTLKNLLILQKYKEKVEEDLRQQEEERKKQEDLQLKESEWLVLCYMDGDNSLNNAIYANMKQIEGGLSKIRNDDYSPKDGFASVQVVALWDGSATSEVPKTQIFRLGNDSNFAESGKAQKILKEAVSPKLKNGRLLLGEEARDLTYLADWILESDNEVDMSDYKTLVNFLNWTKKYYKADHTVLLMADHGLGPSASSGRTLCQDTTSHGNSKYYIYSDQLRMALTEAGYVGENRIDVILMDNCISMTIEDAGEFSTVANYLVGSPHVIPSAGLPYENIFPYLTKGKTARDFSSEIVDVYSELYSYYAPSFAGNPLRKWQQNDCITAFDLQKYDAVAENINSLASLIINSDYKQDYLNMLTGRSVQVVSPLNEPALLSNSISYTLQNYIVTQMKYTDSTNTLAQFLIYVGPYGFYYDIGYFADIFSLYVRACDKTEYMQIYSDLKDSLKSAVVKSWRNDCTEPSSAGGLYPQLGDENYYGVSISGSSTKTKRIQDGYTNLNFAKTNSWYSLLKACFGV